ncbi:unnamed protein product [Prunus armeniaca]|uniref:Uncharacterized protein n=1 Tax=Prunus armeniaca TaxID=36596 RepID=A0A6J5TXQ5_PRUAR|nr:unnamed protein product [Prunus armeniaca]CAB4298973.1 unnamed protein product [Prunus armeniaca]
MSQGGPRLKFLQKSRSQFTVSKANIHALEKTRVPKAAIVHTEVNHEPAPDLLDLGDSTGSTASTVDPFKQLEELLDQTEALTANHGAAGAAKTHDIIGLHADTSLSRLSSSVLPTNRDEFNLASKLSRTAQSGNGKLSIMIVRDCLLRCMCAWSFGVAGYMIGNTTQFKQVSTPPCRAVKVPYTKNGGKNEV